MRRLRSSKLSGWINLHYRKDWTGAAEPCLAERLSAFRRRPYGARRMTTTQALPKTRANCSRIFIEMVDEPTKYPV